MDNDQRQTRHNQMYAETQVKYYVNKLREHVEHRSDMLVRRMSPSHFDQPSRAKESLIPLTLAPLTYSNTKLLVMCKAAMSSVSSTVQHSVSNNCRKHRGMPAAGGPGLPTGAAKHCDTLSYWPVVGCRYNWFAALRISV